MRESATNVPTRLSKRGAHSPAASTVKDAVNRGGNGSGTHCRVASARRWTTLFPRLPNTTTCLVQVLRGSKKVIRIRPPAQGLPVNKLLIIFSGQKQPGQLAKATPQSPSLGRDHTQPSPLSTLSGQE